MQPFLTEPSYAGIEMPHWYELFISYRVGGVVIPFAADYMVWHVYGQYAHKDQASAKVLPAPSTGDDSDEEEEKVGGGDIIPYSDIRIIE